MTIQAEATQANPRIIHEAALRPSTECSGLEAEDDEPPTIARAIATAVLISVPFWALLGFTIYLLF